MLACTWMCLHGEAEGYSGFPNKFSTSFAKTGSLPKLPSKAGSPAYPEDASSLPPGYCDYRSPLLPNLSPGAADLNSGVLTLYPRSFVPSPKGCSKAHTVHTSSLFSTVTLRNPKLQDYSGRGVCGSLKDFKGKRHLKDKTDID